MTAPDMVSVIAGVLFGHALEMWTVDDDGATAQCCCGEGSIIVTPHGEDPDNPAAEWIAAHQARAVLAAIETAGAVEWASRSNGAIRFLSEFTTKKAADRETARFPNDRETVTRVAFPWERAE